MDKKADESVRKRVRKKLFQGVRHWLVCKFADADTGISGSKRENIS